jgi:hypothetical protein
MLCWPGGLCADQLEVEGDRNAASDLVLQSEEIAHIEIEPLCPEMRRGVGVDQLSADAGSRYLSEKFE